MEKTHENLRGTQIFIALVHRVAVVPAGFASKFTVEIDVGVGSRSKKVWNEG